MSNKDDNLIRIGKTVLITQGIPYDDDAWIRSGMTDTEVRFRTIETLGEYEVTSEEELNRVLALTMQGITLKSYLTEMYLDGLIKKSQINFWVRKLFGEEVQ